MIRLVEINKLADFYKVPAETIEKDYIISWILFCFSKSQIKENFVFYGGTAIKRMYIEEHRFSEDIDLISTKKFTLDQILKMTTCLEYAKKQANLVLEVNQNNIIINRSRIQIYINYQGFEEIIGAPKEILVDFNMDMDLHGEIIEKNIIESYSDVKGIHASLNVYSINTILANKFGMLFDLSRNEPRDVYDIWFLLQRINELNLDPILLRNIFRNKYGFNLSVNMVTSKLINNVYLRKNWNIRLSKQMANLPDIDTVINYICKKLNQFF